MSRRSVRAAVETESGVGDGFRYWVTGLQGCRRWARYARFLRRFMQGPSLWHTEVLRKHVFMIKGSAYCRYYDFSTAGSPYNGTTRRKVQVGLQINSRNQDVT